MSLEQQYYEAEKEFMEQQERFYKASAERIRAEDAMTAARQRIESFETRRLEPSRSPGCSTADATIERLRGQLQNCVSHMEGVKRRFPSLENRLDPAIESANKALYETLGR